ncbi:hypothetical protein EN836_30720 [Mesorhizobium sp. M1C.F.Ca.ET.193.01.1.1]|nr:hypothetical protein EN853_30710 [Mesorhizobium sp. M1C.F.Ca.ET.210.01.1.1]TGQ64776.1 hypothetical protein EN855_030725 [Mesorhizobium sp. M1C.F.Ca.ET.212.01.1.1]TGQ98558.1 hypothetical protein EN847_30710 [Mesorhizobium sp. M1C.F.Ca.ET.204.01.1.1]TGR18695.1 hypothetical protein EN839_30710 [Mesorhizobium sp. M1C.F.Ca.ET.196.01.1.1]TGR41028.1 hypothetical protein EN838_30715 [Mesorhizobium sp. M1C.F.Ca.ET.195.01.1.1]TGR60995.1 hypothetical protein EN835_030700 [Mesorhizobium sp. M1C.F.Ca.ET
MRHHNATVPLSLSPPIQKYRRHHWAIDLPSLTVDLCAAAQLVGYAGEDVMSARSLSPTERELLASTAAAGVVGLLPGTLRAWARDDSILHDWPGFVLGDSRRSACPDPTALGGSRRMVSNWFCPRCFTRFDWESVVACIRPETVGRNSARVSRSRSGLAACAGRT